MTGGKRGRWMLEVHNLALVQLVDAVISDTSALDLGGQNQARSTGGCFGKGLAV